MFCYPEFGKNGVKTLTRAGKGAGGFTMMDITVRRIPAGGRRSVFFPNSECALLLTEGRVRFTAGGKSFEASRKNVFDELPSCLHVCRGTRVTVTAITDAELIVQATENAREFPSVFYRPEDVQVSVSCEGRWENTAVRDVNTLFDHDNAPYSNMVLGEVLARQGRWWSYVPHSHPQPEVYYYKLPRPEGFGACFIGDEAHTVKDGSVGAFPGGKTHVQVTAPGYPMYCCWMIRHLDGDPWLKTRTVDPRYEWLED